MVPATPKRARRVARRLGAEPAVEEDDERDREGDRARHPHHARGDLLVAERGEPARPVRERRVGGIERRRGEREHDREYPADEDPAGHIRDPLQPVEPGVEGGRVEDLRPEEKAGEEEERVLEIVHRGTAQGRVVQHGQVPDQQVRVEQHPRGERTGDGAGCRAHRAPARGEQDRAAADRRKSSGSGCQSRLQGADSTISGGATVRRSTCWVMCAAKSWPESESSGESSAITIVTSPSRRAGAPATLQPGAPCRDLSRPPSQ